jgi:flagellar basal-body rod protein FlgG
LYTRAGAFSKDANGQLVNADGYSIVPAITIPATATDVIISETGVVSVRLDTQTALQQVGQLTIANFANETGMEPLGGNLYRPTTASGTAVTGVPGDPSFGTIKQGYLESSNVDPVREITDLIEAQRAYEMNSKVMTAADDMASTVSKGMR